MITSPFIPYGLHQNARAGKMALLSNSVEKKKNETYSRALFDVMSFPFDESSRAVVSVASFYLDKFTGLS